MTNKFKNYGGRGIRVCKRWDIADRKSTGFKNFLSDMGEKPKGFSIERIDNDGNYTPKNCKWASQKEQHRNMRDNVKYQGETAADASLRLTGGRNDALVRNRVLLGWTKERAFTEPCRPSAAVVRYNSESMNAASLRLGGNKNLVSDRIKRGWSLQEAFATKSKTSKRRN